MILLSILKSQRIKKHIKIYNTDYYLKALLFISLLIYEEY